MPIPRLLLLTLVPAFAVPIYILYRTTTPPGSAIRCTLDIPLALRESKLVKLINPNGNPLMTDSWTYTIPRSRISWLSSKPDVSEEEEETMVLARMIRGFFGGRAFAFEQWLLSTMNPFLLVDIYDPSNAHLKSPRDRETFWTWRQWPNDTYVPYGAAYLNSFQLVDSGRDRVYVDEQLPRTFAAVAFGSNRPGRSFVGMHFFSITRRRVTESGIETDAYDLKIWSFNRNPSLDSEGGNGSRTRWLWSWIIPQFHYIYERVLLADAVDALAKS